VITNDPYSGVANVNGVLSFNGVAEKNGLRVTAKNGGAAA